MIDSKIFSGKTNKFLTYLLLAISSVCVIIALFGNVELKAVAAAWFLLP